MTKLSEGTGYSDSKGNHITGSFENCEIIFSGSNSALKIGSNFSCRHMKINIGSGFTVEYDYTVIALPCTEIRFGEDCMLSRRVSVQSNDGHDIFDVKTGKNINAAAELSSLKKVIIGNHVWIGQDATVLYNTDIGDGSIVGAKSLVKNKFPNNCIVGGNPAKLLKTDIAWSRGCGDTDISVIDSRYVRLTEK